MTPSLLATLRAAGEAATKGPWRVSMNGSAIKAGEADDKRIIANGFAVGNDDVITRWLDDAELITHARNHWGELLDEIERLQNAYDEESRRLVEVRDQRDAWAHQCNLISGSQADALNEIARLTRKVALQHRALAAAREAVPTPSQLGEFYEALAALEEVSRG